MLRALRPKIANAPCLCLAQGPTAVQLVWFCILIYVICRLQRRAALECLMRNDSDATFGAISTALDPMFDNTQHVIKQGKGNHVR